MGAVEYHSDVCRLLSSSRPLVLSSYCCWFFAWNLDSGFIIYQVGCAEICSVAIHAEKVPFSLLDVTKADPVIRQIRSWREIGFGLKSRFPAFLMGHRSKRVWSLSILMDDIGVRGMWKRGFQCELDGLTSHLKNLSHSLNEKLDGVNGIGLARGILSVALEAHFYRVFISSIILQINRLDSTKMTHQGRFFITLSY